MDNTTISSILPKIIQFITFKGLHSSTLTDFAAEQGIHPASLDRLFPSGSFSILKAWFDEADAYCQNMCTQDQQFVHLKIREKITFGVKTHLSYLGQHKEALNHAWAYLLQPWHIPEKCRLLYKTADTIWYLAGDTATDWNFYTKRTLLMGVYGTTILCYLQDESENHTETWAFLDRRVNDAIKIPMTLKSLNPFIRWGQRR